MTRATFCFVVGMLVLAAGLLLLSTGCHRGTSLEPPLPEMEGAELPVIQAVQDARQAVLRQPDSPEAWARYGDRLATHRWDMEAIACYREAVRLEPDRFLWHYLEGHALRGSNLQEARVALEQAVALDRSYAPAHHFLAEVIRRIGDRQGALEQYRMAIERNDRLAQAWLGVGQIELAESEYEKAILSLSRALELEPRLLEAHYGLAQAYLVIGDRQESNRHALLSRSRVESPPQVEDPRRLRELSTVGALAHNQRGLVLLEQGNVQEAAGHFQAALKSAPGRMEVLYNLGRVNARQGRNEEAIRMFQQVLVKDPDHTGSHQRLGTLLSQSGLHKEAIPHLERTLVEWPGLTAAHVNLGIALAGIGRLDQAEASFRSAMELAPDDPEIRYNLGVAMAMAGRLETAEKAFLEVLKLSPGDPEAAAALEAVRSIGR